MQSTGGDDDGRLGVVLAHLVSAVVALGAGEIGLASLGLAARRVVAVRVPASRREVGPVVEVEPQLRGGEAGHVLLGGADEGGEVVLGRCRRVVRRLVEGAPGPGGAEVAVGVAAAAAASKVVRGGGRVELKDVVGAVAGDGGGVVVVVVGGGGVGRGEQSQGVGLEVVAQLMMMLPLDAVLLVHDWEQRRGSGARVGRHVGELIAGGVGGSR